MLSHVQASPVRLRNGVDGRAGDSIKALTHKATGGVIAAPTTSLPKQIGGYRNWDYRYCWLRDSLALQGRDDEARELFERLLGVCSPLGLLAEEYDPVTRRQLGNFPQAFSHVGLVNTAYNLSSRKAPAEKRRSN